ncbi:PaREP1 family protein [Pyrolobus fumarii]|uniref:PaREP1 family protein n=1 Tax=Pyrolobus fumarii TaxID=54252 RepID=UPI003CC76674
MSALTDTVAELLEKPLPKPSRDPVGYASARALEALLESLMALEYLGKGYTRNAAGKAFQAWRALTAAILALERDKVLERLEDEKEKEWFLKRGLPRVPSSRLKALGQLVEDLGYPNYGPYTDRVLNLHDYQYHGPDPSGEFSKYTVHREAAKDIVYILAKLVDIIEERVKHKLEEARTWSEIHEETLKRLKQMLNG